MAKFDKLLGKLRDNDRVTVASVEGLVDALAGKLSRKSLTAASLEELYFMVYEETPPNSRRLLLPAGVYDVVIDNPNQLKEHYVLIISGNLVATLVHRTGFAFDHSFAAEGEPHWAWHLFAEKSELQQVARSYSIDFGTGKEVVWERNLCGNITVNRIVADNVSSLSVSINGTAQTLSLTSGVWEGSLVVEDGALVIWNISRTNENTIAAVNVKYNYNT